MPVFWALVIIGVVVLCLLLFPLFEKIGARITKHFHIDDSEDDAKTDGNEE